MKGWPQDELDAEWDVIRADLEDMVQQFFRRPDFNAIADRRLKLAVLVLILWRADKQHGPSWYGLDFANTPGLAPGESDLAATANAISGDFLFWAEATERAVGPAEFARIVHDGIL